MKNILLVEDDIQIANLIRLHFQDSGFSLITCDKAATAFDKIFSDSYHLIILDIMLPDLNGIELCRRIRRIDARTPILMLSSRSQDSDKVMALELGADDYVTKPFSIRELMARNMALLNREARVSSGISQKASLVASSDEPTVNEGPPYSSDKQLIRYRELSIDRHKRKLMVSGKRLELTPKEFDLLCLLAASPGKTFSRHELLELVWGFAFQEYEHTVTAHINRLRIKIEKNLDKPEYILTCWGTGYRFGE